MIDPMRQKALELLDRLPEASLPEAIALLESLSPQTHLTPNKSEITAEETSLIHKIEQRLPPQQQKRFEELREQNEWGELTVAEHRELIEYIETVEAQTVERTEALIQLAKLRNVSLENLLKTFSQRDRLPNVL
ncbi:MAG: hypothetical protein SAJ12_23310 [Jaaginema sp. PMC 1079.18]|nr:hypothetical protein [Jaaginema sp. PMC 1080.18]MEC4853921.1 hypothetical protein [Jaaginema sp. PMC 1079.18]MEC4866128.1 hypothetical protein [Jaaginema sp. PMC 1078.18]